MEEENEVNVILKVESQLEKGNITILTSSYLLKQAEEQHLYFRTAFLYVS